MQGNLNLEIERNNDLKIDKVPRGRGLTKHLKILSHAIMRGWKQQKIPDHQSLLSNFNCVISFGLTAMQNTPMSSRDSELGPRNIQIKRD